MPTLTHHTSVNKAHRHDQNMSIPPPTNQTVRGMLPHQRPCPPTNNYHTNQHQYHNPRPVQHVPPLRASTTPLATAAHSAPSIAPSIHQGNMFVQHARPSNKYIPQPIQSLQPTHTLIHPATPHSPLAYSHFQGPCPPPPPPPPPDTPWRPQQVLPELDRPEINVSELGGKQMLPLEPRPILEPTLDDITMIPMAQFSNIIEILKFRGATTPILSTSSTATATTTAATLTEEHLPIHPDASAFSVVDNKGRETGSCTWAEVLSRAEKISRTILLKSQLRHGSRIGLVYRKSEILDFLAAFYGCLMAGMTAVPINVIEDFAEMVYILSYTQTELALTTEYNHKALARDLSAHRGMDWPEGVTWWKTDTISNSKEKQKKKEENSVSGENWPHTGLTLPDLAYIEYTKAPNGELKGVAVSHRTIISQCHAIKHALGSNPNRKRKSSSISGIAIEASDSSKEQKTSTSLPELIKSAAVTSEGIKADVVMSWLEPRQQVGFVLGALLGVYRGSHTIFVHSGITEIRGLWESCIQRYQATMALGDYEGVRELIQSQKEKQEVQSLSNSLSSLETFLIDTVMVQPMTDRQFANDFLAPLGVTITPEKVIIPISSLPEHGGMILSMRDHLVFPRGADVIDFGFEYDVPRAPVILETNTKSGSSKVPRPRGHSTDSDAICYYLLDREALKNNIIQVIATGEEAIQRATERGAMLVGAFGYATSRATLTIVDPETTALCQPNRVGEIWIDSPSIAFGFWELPKHSQSIFHALPLIVPVDTMIPEVYDPVPAGFLRTGLLGGLIEGRVVIFGLYEDRIQQERPHESKTNVAKVPEQPKSIVNFDFHYIADIVNTVMERITGFKGCIAFECIINNERLPVICAETPRRQRAELQKLSDFIKQAMKDYHGLRPYCIAIAPPGTLPRTYKNGKRTIHPILTRKMLELGRLTLSHLWTSVEETVFNFAMGDDVSGGIWGSEAVIARETALPSHARMIQLTTCETPLEIPDERSKVNLLQFTNLAELLVWRSVMNPEEIAFLGLDHQGRDSKAVTFRKFGMKVVSIANYIEKRGGFRQGEKVVLLFPNGIEFVATMYAVWFLGLVPVPVAIPEPSRLHEDIVMLMGLLTELRVSHVIGNSVTEEVMKQKTTMIHVKACVGARQDAYLPTVFNISKAPKINKALGKESGYSSIPRNALSKSSPAVIYAHYSTDMRRTLVKASHASLIAQCRAFKVQYRLRSRKPLVSCWKTFSGVGLLQSCGLGIYVGAPTVLIQYADFLVNPQIYFEAIERHQVRDVLINYAMLEQALVSQDPQSPLPSLDFSVVRNFLINTEERPRVEVHQAIERRLCISLNSTGFHMERKQIGGMFGHMTNPLIAARSYMNIEPVRLHLSLKSLRRGVVEITSEDEDPTGIWIEDSGIPVSGTTVAIVNPETRELCHSCDIGEIWVSSEANVQGLTPSISPLVIEADPNSANSIRDITASRFNATTVAPGSSRNTSNCNSSLANSASASNTSSADVRTSSITYARTGEVGFLWNYSNENFNGGRATSLLFVLGSIGETFEVNGLIHFPMDVEATIEKAHPNIASSGSIVFQADQAIVCVIQVRQLDSTIVNLTLSVMQQVLDKHQFMPDVIAIVGEDVLAKNRYGEKQRGKMLSLFMSGKMPLLYIHYPRGSLPKSMPEQMHPYNGSQQILTSMVYQSSQELSSASSSGNDSPTTSTSYTSRSLASSSNPSSKGVPSPTSATGVALPARISEKKKSGSVRSSRSATSITGSIASLRSLRSFAGTIFKNSKENNLKNQISKSKSNRFMKSTRLRGIHGSKSEPGLETLSEISSLAEPMPKLKN